MIANDKRNVKDQALLEGRLRNCDLRMAENDYMKIFERDASSKLSFLFDEELSFGRSQVGRIRNFNDSVHLSQMKIFLWGKLLPFSG